MDIDAPLWHWGRGFANAFEVFGSSKTPCRKPEMTKIDLAP